MEKHQFGFAIMNNYTGGIRRKSFWGRGTSIEDCKKNALSQARAYADKLANQEYNKARQRDRSGYAPSRESYTFQIVGCSLWN